MGKQIVTFVNTNDSDAKVQKTPSTKYTCAVTRRLEVVYVWSIFDHKKSILKLRLKPYTGNFSDIILTVRGTR